MTDNHPTIAVPLAQLALIEARGADAAAFLQGQLSNDVRKVDAGQAQLSSHNSAKGRMLAVLHVLRDGDRTRPERDAFLLELHRSLLETTLKRLKMYVLRSKVTLAEAADRALLGVAGPAAAARLEALDLAVPVQPLACAWTGGVGVMRRLGDAPRFSVLAPAAQLAQLQARLAVTAGAEDDWKRLDIEAGVPTVYPETQDKFVAQMCNLDALGGVSFDKGCYTGQEIIARVHYRGAVKRHMSRVLTPQAGVAPGSSLALPDGRSGEVVDAAPHPGGGSVALVVAAAP
jgi:folate-binding protein YgfZ